MKRKDKKPDRAKDKKWDKKKKVISLLIIAGCVIAGLSVPQAPLAGTVSYAQYKEDVAKGRIEKIVVGESDATALVRLQYKEGLAPVGDVEKPTDEKLGFFAEKPKKPTVLLIDTVEELNKVQESGVLVEVYTPTMWTRLMPVVGSLLPMCLFLFIILRAQGMLAKPKKEIIPENVGVTYQDVAGLKEEKAELQLVIDVLKSPKKYRDSGAQPIRGVLLAGPPGVGKTLLAKAIAGEAGVPFFSYSGSEFVEMYVGLGAKRVREMFAEARKVAPCVIFIDEVEVLGAKRGSGSGGAGREADQTLVELLRQMDGVEQNDGVLILAATNRVDILDSAITRPGRFDKVVHIGPPKTREDREEIIKVHLGNKKLEEGVEIKDFQDILYGMTGAEIKGVLNEAVLVSITAGRDGYISVTDVEEGVGKLVFKGVLKGKHSKEEKHRVIWHEVGHAVVGEVLGKKISQIAVQPYNSGVGGFTRFVEDGSNALKTREDLEREMSILLGGRCGEEVFCNSISVGAQSDLERLKELVKMYLCDFAMGINPFVISEKTLEEEGGKLVQQVYAKTLQILEENKLRCEELYSQLDEKEKITFEV